MIRGLWRWSEKDFNFRFRGGGKAKADYYQASEPGAFYTVPAKQRKLTKERIEQLAHAQPSTSPRVVPTPWTDYDRDWDWDWITADGILLNFAGCLDKEEIDRREDEGVQSAMELVIRLVDTTEPPPVTVALVQTLHTELMGSIYPIAGAWRTVALHKGEGATKWPWPPGGIEPLIDVLDRDVLSRSPFVSDDDDKMFAYVSEAMGEFLATHPFREGNGRTAFILGNLVLMQNDLLPLNVYDRKRDEARYYAACEEVRVHKNYGPFAGLIAEWEDAAQSRWETSHGE